MDILLAFQVIPVTSASSGRKTLFDKCERDIQKQVKIRLRYTEILELSPVYPFGKPFPFFRIFQFSTLVGHIGKHVPVQNHHFA